jgi:hypothetical protein
MTISVRTPYGKPFMMGILQKHNYRSAVLLFWLGPQLSSIFYWKMPILPGVCWSPNPLLAPISNAWGVASSLPRMRSAPKSPNHSSAHACCSKFSAYCWRLMLSPTVIAPLHLTRGQTKFQD